MNRPKPSFARTGARIGMFVGSTAWIVGLTILCLATGRTQYLLPVCLPLFLAAVGLSLLALLAVEPRGDTPPPADSTTVLGAVWVVLGVLLLLANAMVTPLLEREEALGNAVRDSGGVSSMPNWIAIAGLFFGCVLLARRLRRSAA